MELFRMSRFCRKASLDRPSRLPEGRGEGQDKAGDLERFAGFVTVTYILLGQELVSRGGLEPPTR